MLYIKTNSGNTNVKTNQERTKTKKRNKNQKTTRLKAGENIIINKNIRETMKRKILKKMKTQAILMNIKEIKKELY